jgi:rod shape-determining protein MreC
MVAVGIVMSPKNRYGDFDLVQRLTVEAVAPVQEGFDFVTRSLVTVWESYVDLLETQRRNEELRNRAEELEYELNLLREDRAENLRLRKLLEFKRQEAKLMIPAQVVAWDPSKWVQTIMIDKGSKAGVGKNMAVVSYAGIVGRVIAVSPHYAKVLLILDQNSSVNAILQSSRARAILGGMGTSLCELRYVSPSEYVAVDESVVTSGLSGFFPKGLLLGYVKSAEQHPGELFQSIQVVPAVDFSTLEEVMVILDRSGPFMPESTESEPDADS